MKKGGGGRIKFFLLGCVSMGYENRPILKGLNNENSLINCIRL